MYSIITFLLTIFLTSVRGWGGGDYDGCWGTYKRDTFVNVGTVGCYSSNNFQYTEYQVKSCCPKTGQSMPDSFILGNSKWDCNIFDPTTCWYRCDWCKRQPAGNICPYASLSYGEINNCKFSCKGGFCCGSTADGCLACDNTGACSSCKQVGYDPEKECKECKQVGYDPEKECKKCLKDFYKSGEICIPYTICSPGKYISVNGTNTTDRKCKLCNQPGEGTDRNKRNAVSCSNCPAGKYSDNVFPVGICKTCPNGKFANEIKSTE